MEVTKETVDEPDTQSPEWVPGKPDARVAPVRVSQFLEPRGRRPAQQAPYHARSAIVHAWVGRRRLHALDAANGSISTSASPALLRVQGRSGKLTMKAGGVPGPRIGYFRLAGGGLTHEHCRGDGTEERVEPSQDLADDIADHAGTASTQLMVSRTERETQPRITCNQSLLMFPSRSACQTSSV